MKEKRVEVRKRGSKGKEIKGASIDVRGNASASSLPGKGCQTVSWGDDGVVKKKEILGGMSGSGQRRARWTRG